MKSMFLIFIFALFFCGCATKEMTDKVGDISFTPKNENEKSFNALFENNWIPVNSNNESNFNKEIK